MSSQSYNSELCCPKCNSIMTGIVWDKVDGDANPELKTKVLNGAIFKTKCATCNHEFNVVSEFSYTETSIGLYVYFLPTRLRNELTSEEISQMKAVLQMTRQLIPNFYDVDTLDETISIIKQHSAQKQDRKENKMQESKTIPKLITKEYVSQLAAQLGYDLNDKNIQFFFGTNFLKGNAVSENNVTVFAFQKDEETGIAFIKRAADQNHGQAQYILGHYYAGQGKYSNSNYIIAARLFKKAEANKSIENASEALYQLRAKMLKEYRSLTGCGKPESTILQQIAIVEQPEIDEHWEKSFAHYESETLEKSKTPNSKNGCFVATAVYGSYEAEEVRVLRQFRDLVLSRHALTAWTVWLYYKIGPRLASTVVRSAKLRFITKAFLDRIVHAVNKRMKQQ